MPGDAHRTMRTERADRDVAMGWYAGPWGSDLAVAAGGANDGIDEPQVRADLTAIYLVARV